MVLCGNSIACGCTSQPIHFVRAPSIESLPYTDASLSETSAAAESRARNNRRSKSLDKRGAHRRSHSPKTNSLVDTLLKPFTDPKGRSHSPKPSQKQPREIRVSKDVVIKTTPSVDQLAPEKVFGGVKRNLNIEDDAVSVKTLTQSDFDLVGIKLAPSDLQSLENTPQLSHKPMRISQVPETVRWDGYQNSPLSTVPNLGSLRSLRQFQNSQAQHEYPDFKKSLPRIKSYQEVEADISARKPKNKLLAAKDEIVIHKRPLIASNNRKPLVLPDRFSSQQNLRRAGSKRISLLSLQETGVLLENEEIPDHNAFLVGNLLKSSSRLGLNSDIIGSRQNSDLSLKNNSGYWDHKRGSTFGQSNLSLASDISVVPEETSQVAAVNSSGFALVGDRNQDFGGNRDPSMSTMELRNESLRNSFARKNFVSLNCINRSSNFINRPPDNSVLEKRKLNKGSTVFPEKIKPSLSSRENIGHPSDSGDPLDTKYKYGGASYLALSVDPNTPGVESGYSSVASPNSTGHYLSQNFEFVDDENLSLNIASTSEIESAFSQNTRSASDQIALFVSDVDLNVNDTSSEMSQSPNMEVLSYYVTTSASRHSLASSTDTFSAGTVVECTGIGANNTLELEPKDPMPDDHEVSQYREDDVFTPDGTCSDDVSLPDTCMPRDSPPHQLHSFARHLTAKVSCVPGPHWLHAIDHPSLSFMAYYSFLPALHDSCVTLQLSPKKLNPNDVGSVSVDDTSFSCWEHAILCLVDEPVDRHLSRQQMRVAEEYRGWLRDNLGPVVTHYLWGSEDNFRGLTRPWCGQHGASFWNRATERTRARNLALYNLDSTAETERKLERQAGVCFQMLDNFYHDRAYFFGDRPSSVDAEVFGFLAPILFTPNPSRPEIKLALEQNSAVVSLLMHIKDRLDLLTPESDTGV